MIVSMTSPLPGHRDLFSGWLILIGGRLILIDCIPKAQYVQYINSKKEDILSVQPTSRPILLSRDIDDFMGCRSGAVKQR
jgi:hypothetical protein